MAGHMTGFGGRMPRVRLSRRELAAAASLLAGVAASGARAHQKDQDHWDVVVVGAGFAGLIAARELRHAGYSVMVVEARDRIGGRTHSERQGDHVVEYGGTWVHWTQPYIWTEIHRYGAGLIETPSSTPQRIVIARSDGPQEIPLHEAGAALSSSLSKVLGEAEKVFPRPFDPAFSSDEVRLRAGLSLAERAASAGLTALEHDLFSAYFATLGHCPLEELAYTEALRGWSLVGSSYERFSDALARYRLRDGTSELLKAIAADAGADITLNAAVVEVVQSGDGVTVRCANGKTYRGGAAVVTAPLNTLGAIKFSPGLNQAKRAHSKERHAGRGVKGYATIDQQVGLLQGFAPDPGALTNIMTDATGPWGSRLIFFGPDAARLDVTDPRAVEQALRAFIPGAKVLELVSHDWNHDPYALGTWCHFRPGQQTRFFPADRATEGRVLFAGADTADGWRGFIDGAVERGIRVARETAEMLGGARRPG